MLPNVHIEVEQNFNPLICKQDYLVKSYFTLYHLFQIELKFVDLVNQKFDDGRK